MRHPDPAARSQSGRVARAVWRQLIERVYPKPDGTPALEAQPFQADYPMVPYTRSKRFGWTHYGVMIPDLPAPRRSATLVSVTAATYP